MSISAYTYFMRDSRCENNSILFTFYVVEQQAAGWCEYNEKRDRTAFSHHFLKKRVHQRWNLYCYTCARICMT